MSLTYTWAITSLRKTSNGALQDIVMRTTWTCTGTDENGLSGSFDGATPFPLDTVNPDAFVPYDQLTEGDVLGWVQAIVSGPYKEHIDAQIMKQIAAKTAPAEEVARGRFPWSDPSEVLAGPPVGAE